MQGYTFYSNDPFDLFFGGNSGYLSDGPDADSLPDLWIVVPEYTGSTTWQGAILILASEDLATADTLGGNPEDGQIEFESLFSGGKLILPNSYLLVGGEFGSGYTLHGHVLGDIDGDGEEEFVFTDLEAETKLPGFAQDTRGASYVFSWSDLAELARDTSPGAAPTETDGILALEEMGNGQGGLRFANYQTDGASVQAFSTGAADLDGDGDVEIAIATTSHVNGSLWTYEINVISTSDLAALTSGGEVDLAGIDSTATPQSWVFYTDPAQNFGGNAYFLNYDAAGPSELVISTTLSDSGALDAGGFYLLDLSDAAALSDADDDDETADHRIQLSGAEQRLDNSYFVYASTANANTQYLGTLGDIDGDGLAEIVAHSDNRVYVLSSRDFATADGLDAGGIDRAIDIADFRGLSHSYVIEATDGAFDVVRAIPSTLLSHDGDTVPDIVMTGTRFLGPDDFRSTVLILSSSALAAADGNDDGVIEASEIGSQAGSYEIRVADGAASIQFARAVADMDGDGRAELLLDSSLWDDTGGNSKAHLVLSTDLPPGGGTIEFDTETGLPICFTSGTLIATPGGEVAVERIVPGDLVLTRDHGPQPVRWIGCRHLTAAELRDQPRFVPVRIARGALGQGLPRRDLVVSPQHRILLTGPAARRIGGAREILVAAKHLCGLPGIAAASSPDGIDYLHLLFDRHEIVFAEGAATESLHTGPMALAALSPAARAEIYTLFPELAWGEQRPMARPVPPGRAARRFVRHGRQATPLLA